MIEISSKLKIILMEVVEEDCQKKKLEIEKSLLRFKSLLLEIARTKKLELAISVIGSHVEASEDEKALELLERGKLVKGKRKYTEHNAYCEYQLTKKGSELLKKLQKET